MFESVRDRRIFANCVNPARFWRVGYIFLHTYQPILPHTREPILVRFFRHPLYIPPVKPILVWKFRQTQWEKSALKCIGKKFSCPESVRGRRNFANCVNPARFWGLGYIFCTHVSQLSPHIYKQIFPSKNCKEPKVLGNVLPTNFTKIGFQACA